MQTILECVLVLTFVMTMMMLPFFLLWEAASNDKKRKDRAAAIKAYKQDQFDRVEFMLLEFLGWADAIEIDYTLQQFKYKVVVWDKPLYSSAFPSDQSAVSFTTEESDAQFQSAKQVLSSLDEVQKIHNFTNFLTQFEECKTWISNR